MIVVKALLFVLLVAVAWPLAVLFVAVWVPCKLLVLTGKATWWSTKVTARGAVVAGHVLSR